MTGLFRKGRYANVTATLALIVALGGTSYAATTLSRNSVGSAQIKRNAVSASEIKRNAVGASEIKARAVGNSEVRGNSVTGSKVKNNSLTGTDIVEATLSGVNATTLGGTSANALRNELQTFSFHLTDDQARTIATSGPLTMIAKCAIDDGADDSATVSVTTTVDNVTVSGGGPPDEDFDITENPRDATISEPAGTIAYGPIGAYFAAAPDGSQLGSVGAFSVGLNVHGLGNTCYFHGAVFVGTLT